MNNVIFQPLLSNPIIRSAAISTLIYGAILFKGHSWTTIDPSQAVLFNLSRSVATQIGLKLAKLVIGQTWSSTRIGRGINFFFNIILPCSIAIQLGTLGRYQTLQAMAISSIFTQIYNIISPGV